MEHPSTLPQRDAARANPPTAAPGPAEILRYMASGFVMGGADVIPGVSGGTVALVLGIYQRLVTAISRCDLQLCSYLRRGQLRAGLAYVDSLFLVSLGTGILLGVVALGGLINELLSHPLSRPCVLAALFGLIAGSAVFVAKLVGRGERAHLRLLLPAGALGALFAAWLTRLTAYSSNTDPPYVFLCGVIAICAMILPGISGAYLLLILGLYDHITGILKDLPRGQATSGDLATLAIFATGCAVGLISFSKLLRWLLQHYRGITMAVLCGFMVGALSKVWPFQKDLTPHETRLSHKHFENILPGFNTELGICLAIAAASFLGVLYLDAVAARRKSKGSSRRGESNSL